MQLTKHNARYELPPFSEVNQAAIASDGEPRTNPRSFWMNVYQISLHEMAARSQGGEEVLGRPTCYAVDRFNQRIIFWPTPDQDYVAEVRGYGPVWQA